MEHSTYKDQEWYIIRHYTSHREEDALRRLLDSAAVLLPSLVDERLACVFDVDTHDATAPLCLCIATTSQEIEARDDIAAMAKCMVNYIIDPTTYVKPDAFAHEIVIPHCRDRLRRFVNGCSPQSVKNLPSDIGKLRRMELLVMRIRYRFNMPMFVTSAAGTWYDYRAVYMQNTHPAAWQQLKSLLLVIVNCARRVGDRYSSTGDEARLLKKAHQLRRHRPLIELLRKAVQGHLGGEELLDFVEKLADWEVAMRFLGAARMQVALKRRMPTCLKGSKGVEVFVLDQPLVVDDPKSLTEQVDALYKGTNRKLLTRYFGLTKQEWDESLMD